jgi:hypothetical protein
VKNPNPIVSKNKTKSQCFAILCFAIIDKIAPKTQIKI